MQDGTELVVLSHLRWTFVWQRPQHIVSRLARRSPTWFVEEPVAAEVTAPRLRCEEHGTVTRVWLEVPGTDAHVSFDDPRCETYGEELQRLLGDGPRRVAWLYTPLALPMVDGLGPETLVYDVMDDLASFKGASEALRLRHRQTLRAADVVFTGGRSLHRGVLQHRSEHTHLFPSGVEPEHFSPARRLRRPGPQPVAGYVGVIDERLDLELIAGLAGQLDDWRVEMVGPVLKIDQASLPQAPNLTYTGSQPYERLPEVLGRFDVALMPFALNEATRSISPTKTLEYLAAGLPVVSTRVPDVVADHSAVVDLAEDVPGFAAACRRNLADPPRARNAAVDALLRRQHWDSIAGRMSTLITGMATGAAAGTREVVS